MGRELEEIKKDFEWGIKCAGKGQGYANLDDEQVEWMISTIEGLKGEVERLKIALHTHESYDKTVCELQQQVETYRKALEEIVPCIQTMQCTSESESLRYNTGNLVIHKIRKALGNPS